MILKHLSDLCQKCQIVLTVSGHCAEKNPRDSATKSLGFLDYNRFAAIQPRANPVMATAIPRINMPMFLSFRVTWCHVSVTRGDTVKCLIINDLDYLCQKCQIILAGWRMRSFYSQPLSSAACAF